MSDIAIGAAGVVVFALTTWASLAFGYQVFQHMWETDQEDDVVPVVVPATDRATRLLTTDTADEHVAVPRELVTPAIPPA